MNSKKIAVSCCAITIATGIAFADPNPPTVFSPTPGIAPCGLTVGSQVYFTQPFADTNLTGPRAVYSIGIPGAGVTKVADLPPGNNAENSVAIVPTGALTGFTPGDIYATSASPNDSSKDAVYKLDKATKSWVLFIDLLPATLSQHQPGITFDKVGSFNGAMIVTADSTVTLYGANGAKLRSFSDPQGYVLQAVAVAPLGYVAKGINYGGFMFITAESPLNIDAPEPGVLDGKILTVAPNALDGTPPQWFTTTVNIPDPESIQFVTADSLSCTLNGFTYFAAGYATGDQINTYSNNGAILGWTPAQLSLAGAVGHYLVQNEESGTVHNIHPGTIWIDAGLPTQQLFSDPGYQLEDTAIVQCTPAKGCPATQGFWHQANHWPAVNGPVSADGVTWDGTYLWIGTQKYTRNQILQVLPSGALHSGNVANGLSQFIAAALNLIAGAQHNATIDGMIGKIVTDLNNTPLFVPPQRPGGPVTLNQLPAAALADLTNFLNGLDAYNSAQGMGCTEAAGLTVGK